MTDTPTWKLIAFDLDDTLAPSKSALPPAMAVAVRGLLDVCEVAVISGGALPQFRMQLLDGLEASAPQLRGLHLLPTCGTQYLRFDETELRVLHSHTLPQDLRLAAIEAVESSAKELGLWEEQTWGDIIEDRGSQITFSALGQEAPLDAKKAWDPTGEKKNWLAQRVALLLPELEVRSGGSTSVDITEKGIDKAYGMNALALETGYTRDEVLFIGDRLDPNGNDYPVKAAGWNTRAVTGWEETVGVINEIVDALRR